MTKTMNDTLTAVPGIRVGHVTNLDAATGCTVILCPPNTVGGVDVRGGAPGTRETDLLLPHNRVQTVNGVVLSGGSAYGLGTADGVMRYLAENGEGYQTRGGHVVPIVPAAILFDLAIGDAYKYPDATMGYQAAHNATTEPVAQGTVGAGTGAVCGAMLGKDRATKGGIGSASVYLDDELVVAALVAVNAVGDVIDESGQVMAGLRNETADGFVGMTNALRGIARETDQIDQRENTVIGTIATNARLNKAEVNKVAQMAHDGIARAINPAHTMFDGDTIFALATGEIPSNPTVIGAFAAEVMAKAIRQAILHATGLDGVRAVND